MVYIKSLICEGFKSFKQKTKVNFCEGFTSIVGANGSGKSNILDAFVFALGELSGNKLRVNSIKDLICNGGTDGHTPSKFARVDIVFDNSDRSIPVNSSAVKVSRKIDINGHGKYYINDKTITRRELQDIMELAGLAPNSTNLIQQGELFRIINMNNNERRGLIEDISGIAYYNEKKEKAENDLEKIEENISRITLLLNEVSIQLDSLETEKNDALKYQEQDIKQKNAEKAVIVKKIRSFKRQIERINATKEDMKKEVEQINVDVIDKRESLMKITLELDQINDEIEKLQSNELKEFTLRLNKLRTEFTKKETQKENTEKELVKQKKNIISIFNKKDKVEEKKTSIQQELEFMNENKKEIKEKLESLKEELYHSEEQVNEFDTEYSAIQEDLDNLRIKISEKIGERNEINSEIKVINNNIKNIDKNIKETQRRISQYKNEIETIINQGESLEQEELQYEKNSESFIDIEELEQEKIIITSKLKEISNRIDEKHDKLISIKSKIKAVQKLSVNRAINAILKLKQNPDEIVNSGRIYGTIAQLGKSSQKYNTALQVAGGNKFNYIVVENQATAIKCINYLKRNKIGRASFIPLDKIKNYPINFNFRTNNKVIGRAVDLIQFDSQFNKVFEFVFGRTIVVADLDTASSLENNVRRVTLDGDIIESSNLMTGGNTKQIKQGGFLSIEESKIPELESELNVLKNKEAEYKNSLHELDKKITTNYKRKISKNHRLEDIRQKLAVLKDKIENNEEGLINAEQKYSELKVELEENSLNLEKEKNKLTEFNQDVIELENRENELKLKISLLKNNDFTKKINVLRKDIDTLEKQKMKIDIEVTKFQTQLEEIVNNTETEIKNAIENIQNEIATNTNELRDLESEIEETQQKVDELEKVILEKNQIIGRLYKSKEDTLKKQTNIKLEIEDLKSKIHPINIRINTLDVNLENIITQKEELENSSNVDPSEVEEIQEFISLSYDNLSEIISTSIEIKLQLEPVNMRAIKKFDKIKKRYDGLIEKHEIIVKEREAILNFIEKVEVEKKNTFMETFNGINKNFQEIFTKLSPGGEAKLELENQEDPFAGGVKMLARPGDKKWCITQSMSGGEKTLTVVALILGIQLYIPSPYYILDEIDAAFDDYNATQVATLIKQMSERSQFILITHRDVTMTKTDQLLGVSNVNGITTIINLNIKEALEQIAQT
jgi:chromosome segregation protein